MAGKKGGEQPAFRALIDKYADKYGYLATEPERGLEGFAAHLFAMEEGFDAVLDGSPTHEADLAAQILRRDDLGIDAVLEDEENRSIILIQAAWRKELPEDKVDSFFSKPDLLMQPDYIAKGGEQVIDLLGAFPDKVADGWDVSLRFATNKRIGEDGRLRALVEAKNNAYQAQGRSISCELYGETELMAKYDELTSSARGAAVPEAKLKVGKERMISLGPPDMPFKTLLCVIKATELVSLYKRDGVGNRLFNLNIRLPLASRKINPSIEKTAGDSEEGPRFFYYNNGISAVCSAFDVDGTEVTAKRLQIINGAQTVYSLVKAANSKKLQTNTVVLLRLTATGESYGGTFTDKVIAYNNTQNPVKASDFFSNDPLHQHLVTEFAQRSGKGPVPKFDYVYKSGQNAARYHKALKIDELANIRHAFIYGPVQSYKEPKAFFQLAPEGLYEQAFGVDGVRVSSWSTEEVARFCVAYAIVRRVTDIHGALKKDPEAADALETKYLFRSARYMAALVGVGLEAAKASGFKDFTTLSASKAQFDKYVDPLLDRARDIFDSAIRPRWDQQLRPEYNFLRDPTEWKGLSERMRDAVKTKRVKFT